MLDLGFLDQVVAGLPVLKDLPPEARSIVYTGVLVQLVISIVRMAATKSASKTGNSRFNRFMSRFGPVVNVALGLALSQVSTIPTAIGLIGGGFSQWTYAFFNKTAAPLVKAAGSKVRQVMPGTGG